MKINEMKCIHWLDPIPTGAEGWLVFDSLQTGIASGGIFMHPTATLQETADLAATMTLKNSLQQPIIGGAKGGICFDHHHSDAKEVLKRFLIANKYYIENHWNTGSDLNTDNTYIQQIIQQDLGLSSGFTSLAKMLNYTYQIPNREKNFNDCIKLPASHYFNLTKGATGFSVATCIQKLCPRNSNILIQGFGSVGSSLTYFIEKLELGNIVGIIEKDYFIYADKHKFSFFNLFTENQNNIPKLFQLAKSNGLIVYERDVNQSSDQFLIDCLLKQKADIFSPCAARYVITDGVVDALSKHTLKDSVYPWIIAGANNIFKCDALLLDLFNLNINVLPEWIANSGNTLLYNEVLKYAASIAELPEKIFLVIKERINHFLDECITNNFSNNTCLYERCNEKARLKVTQANLSSPNFDRNNGVKGK